MGTLTIKKISVIGSGMMGHAIAEEFAVAGYEVILYGRSEEKLKQAMANLSLLRSRQKDLGSGPQC